MHLLKKNVQKFLSSHVGSSALKTGAVRSLAIAIVLLFSLVMARVLGAADYGHFAFIWSWLIVLATVATLGTDVLVVREIGREAAVTPSTRSSVVAWSVGLIAISSAVVAVAAFFFQDYFTRSQGTPMSVGFYAMLGCVPLLAFVRLLQGVLQAKGESAASQVPQLILMPVFTLVIVIGFKLSGKLDVGTAFVSMLLALAASLLTGLWYYFSKVRKPALGGHDGRPAPNRGGWLIGSVALGVVAVASMANEQIGVILLGSYGHAESAGAFDIIRKMALVVSLGLMMVNVPLAPVIARKLEAKEIGDLQSEIKSATRFASLVSLIVAALIGLFGKFVLGLLDPGYAAVYPALLVLVLGQLINVASGPVWLILNMAGLVRFAAVGLVVGGGVNFLTSILLLENHGVIGVAAGALAGLITWNVIQLYFVRKYLHINASIL